MATQFPLKAFEHLRTPFYYYDLDLLRQSLDVLKNEARKHRVHVHYAVKANANPRILSHIQMAGFGADCVSGGEIRAAIQCGFSADKIVFAGVGKADWEINLALEHDIFCFNVESLPELEIINDLAAQKSKKARVALRINPDVQADTHHYIRTGSKENKFGINLSDLESIVEAAQAMSHIELVGIHFHIGSQITEMNNFAGLAARVNDIQERLLRLHWIPEHVNLGGGLGIDYHHPDEASVPDFADYFATLRRMLKLRPEQTLHVEPGRSVVGQCGSLIARVLYVKDSSEKHFAILDAGMTELIRPALYQAYHKIEHISTANNADFQKYDVVGPICESSDCFGKEVELPLLKRGDLVAIRSAGAYGEIMSSNYNCRPNPAAYFSDDLQGYNQA